MPSTPLTRRILWTLAALTLVCAVAAPKVLPLLSAKTPSAKTEGHSKSGGALKVSTIVVQPAPFSETVLSTGTLRAEEAVELQAEINGKVVAIHFTEGARVRKGELLVKLNDADLRATHARASHRKQLAELREHRLAQLVKQGVVKQDDYDTALNELNVQIAEIDLTEAQIAKTEIRAPFEGIVGLRYVSEGAFVNAATRVATLQRLDKLKVDFAVPEKYASRIRAGSPISFTVAGGDHRFDGTIYAFDPRIDSATRTVLIRAVCPNPAGRLLPGAFANVRMTLRQIDNALLVPTEAVIPGVNEKNVYVMVDGKVERRAVETGTRMESVVHILAGLNSGDVVIISGLQQMRVGMPVITDEIVPSAVALTQHAASQ